jgi:diguanylate cyclase (GGDEF)-like protein/PAS domain S-box-containing protein
MTPTPQAPDSCSEQPAHLRDIATRDVVDIAQHSRLGQAARIMAERHISSILVVDDAKHPLGIITERNILRAMQAGHPPDTPVTEIMSAPIISVPELMTCQEGYLLCQRKGIRHLVLIDASARLAGVVSETDFRLHMNLTTLAGRRPVAAVMTRSVLSLPPEASLREALELMEEHCDDCVVVVADKHPVGIVTERDVVRLYAHENAQPTLGEIMVSPVRSVATDTTVNDAASHMLDARVRHLVVLDHAGGLAGMINEHDLTQTMALGLIDSKLDAERAFLRTLVDTIPDLVWLKDPNGVFLACNPRFERLTHSTEADIVGKTDYDLVGRELADFFREHDLKAIAKGAPSVNEEWVTFADDGHRELLETIKTPMRDTEGRLIGVLGIGRDITSARSVQEALRDSEEKLRTLIDAIPDAVQFKDETGNWLAYNRTAARIFGLEGVDCRDKSDAELAALVAPEYRDTLLRCQLTDREVLLSGEVARGETTIPQAGGERLVFEITKVPIFQADGKPKGLVTLARDVTDSRLMTQALQQSLHDFNDLVSRIPVGVFKFRSLAGGGYRFEYVSTRWSEMAGITAEAVYADADALFRRIHQEDRASLLGGIENARLAGKPLDWEGRLTNGDAQIWLHIAATPALLPNGDVQWDGTQYDITERKQSEQRLAMVNFALNHITDAAFLADQAGRFHYVNDEACRSLGYSQEALLELNVSDIDYLTRDGDWASSWARIKQTGTHIFESRHRTRDGSVFPVEIRATHFEYLGRPYVLGLVHDISARKKAEEGLRLAASVFTNTHEGIVITDAAANIVEINEAFSRITGYSRAEVLGKNPSLLRSGYQGREFYQAMWQALNRGGHWNGEVWNRRKDGRVYAELLTISAVLDERGETSHYVGVFADITPFKEHEQRLERIAHFDALTGVPNRVLLADRITQAIAQTQRGGNLMAVCYLDLDGFKPINDTFGHEAGDRVLVETAQRMKNCLRGGDTIARIGGDEFVLLLLGLGRMEECETALLRILDTIAQPLIIAGQRVSLSASLGVTLYPEDDADADTLLRHADQAMYQAKDSGKNRYHLFDPEHDRQIRQHRENQLRLAQALLEGEFELHYQPKVNMTTGELIGVEALARWRHPERGELQPADFLPTIKGSELEIALGEWVLDTALDQISAWQTGGLQITVSVNIGATHLLQPNFAERLQAILARYPDTAPDSLELEILESTAIADIGHASKTLAACRRLGVQFALDDFGTGYSSLTYFRRLPVETLKIDQSFVRGMLDDPEDLGIVESVVQLAQAFNRSVIAEGVETQQHCAMLSRMRCHVGQGFGIARPMAADRLPDWAAHWYAQRKWRDFAQIPLPRKRKDMVLKTAVESHRKWVDGLAEHLRHPNRAPEPPLDPRQCRFGQWYHGSGSLRYGHLNEFAELDAMHEDIHTLAEELEELAEHGQRGEAMERLPKLYGMRDNFVAALEHLIGVVGSKPE